ncbi:MAG: hypothetical protein IMZ53_10890 [Thermoplasmata archaeon]|nr:hypothetical protein [Thermoplasmata archaeon]MBE3141073.1 hypothetical protein [Thermoplasmata archaeon]
MVKQVAGTSQWRKLIFTKEHSDTYGAVWKISAWKGLFWILSILIILIIIYSFSVQNQTGYFQNTIFYAILTMVVILAIWVAGNFIWKAREFVIGFLLALPIIFVFYAGMGFILSFIGWHFNYGPVTWIMIVAVSMMGARRLDGSLDKKDLFFGIMVFIIFVGGNAPVFENGLGFFAKFDEFIKMLTDILSKIIHPGDLVAK